MKNAENELEGDFRLFMTMRSSRTYSRIEILNEKRYAKQNSTRMECSFTPVKGLRILF